MGVPGSVRKTGIVIPAKNRVISVVVSQWWETGRGMFDRPAELAGDDQAGNCCHGRLHAPAGAPPPRATFSRRCRLRPAHRWSGGTYGVELLTGV